MEESNTFELMYRRPRQTEYENVTKVLDDILNRLERIEQSLDSDDNPGLTG